MSAHTPGPWVVVADAGQSVSPRDGYLVRWTDGLGVECDIARVREVPMLGAGEAIANAALIAAAPDLLAFAGPALEVLADLLAQRSGGETTDAHRDALAELRRRVELGRSAIAKARGGR